MSLSRTASRSSANVQALAEGASKQHELYGRVATDFGPSLARLAAAHESDHNLQQDLLQDIHVALWRSFATFENQCSLRTWVYRVAHNTAATHVRKQRRARQSYTVGLEELDDIPHEFDSDRCVDEAVVLARLQVLIQQLKPLDRDVLMLYLEGVEAAEIAAVVGISRSNVAQKVHRTKKLLRRYFCPEASNDDTK